MQPETRRGVATALRLAVAHHPLCGYFRDDVFGRRLGVCAGCAVTWPLFFLMLPVTVAAVLGGADPSALLAAGMVLGLPQASTLVYRGGRLWRAAVKAVGGVGLAMVVAGGSFLPVSMGIKVTGASVLALAMVAFLAVRMRSILRTCDACPWQRDWAHCPGFGFGPRGEDVFDR